MISRVLSVAASIFLLISFQIILGQVPPRPNESGCFGLAVSPEAFDTVSSEIMVRPPGPDVRLTAPVYDTLPEQIRVTDATTGPVIVDPVMVPVQERILIEEAHTKIVLVPPVYDTIVQVIQISPTRMQKMVVPAQYDTLVEQVQISEGGWEWQEGELDPDCISDDPEDCRERCLVRNPAAYQKVEKLVMTSAPSVVTKQVPAVYDTVYQLVEREPAGYQEVEVPARYDTITHHLLKSPGSVEQGVYPARYQTVNRLVLRNEERIIRDSLEAEYVVVPSYRPENQSPLVWVKIPCASDIDVEMWDKLAQALRDNGHDPGSGDHDHFSSGLQGALRSFQRSQGLPQGQMDFETLKLLGLR